MPDGTFGLSVLTPEEELLSVAARAVLLRTSDGDMMVLDGHTPLVTDVVPGDVRVDPEEGDPVHLAVHGGYLQVETGPGLDGADARSTRATLLAGVAELAAGIDPARATRARAQALARVEELRGTAGRGGTGPAGGAGGAGPGTGAQPEGTAAPADLELAAAEAALARAELRLAVAGASPQGPEGTTDREHGGGR